MRSFFYRLDKMIEKAEIDKNEKLFFFCRDVKEYIMKGTFTRYKKVETYLDYWGETDSYMSARTGIKESTIRVTRRDLSNALYELFGYDFFTILEKGDKESITEGLYRLALASKQISSKTYVHRSIIHDIRDGAVDMEFLDLEDCRNEIEFLSRHSLKRIEKELSMLDKNKLAYLLGMLDNEKGSSKDIVHLVKRLER